MTSKHGAPVQTTMILGAFLIGALILGRYLSRIARFSSFTVTGGVYVLLGLILGPNITGVMSANTLSALTPLISLLLGVFGADRKDNLRSNKLARSNSASVEDEGRSVDARSVDGRPSVEGRPMRSLET